MAKKLTLKDFVDKARKVHGDKYDYSSLIYVNNSTKINIVCRKHGFFTQLPSSHLMGNGCPKCANEERGKNKSSSKDNFIQKAKKVHNNKYDYSKVNYVNNQTKVCIVCPEHGEFWQRPNNHLNGQGCPICSKLNKKNKNKSNTTDFIEKSKKIHGDKYKYSKVNYINSKTKVCIICPEHGEFWQTPNSHLQGQGCPKCVGLGKTIDEWIEEANNIHNYKYNYSQAKYINAITKIKIICPIHGEFYQKPSTHLNGHGCPMCGNLSSKAENEITEFLKTLNPQQRNRSILKNNELDIYIPSLKLGIEYNGLLWHSELYNRNKYYHLNKLVNCNSKGVDLIQIFEDEWLNNKEICKYNLMKICGLTNILTKIDSDSCVIKVIRNKDIIKDFLNKNDINGNTRFSICLGAYKDDILICVMTLLKHGTNWVLNRCAQNIQFYCEGIEKQILDTFIRLYQPQKIIAFADRRWTIHPQNNLFTQIGFKFDGYTAPKSYFYNTNIRFKRFTKTEINSESTCTKIWDCGLIKYTM